MDYLCVQICAQCQCIECLCTLEGEHPTIRCVVFMRVYLSLKRKRAKLGITIPPSYKNRWRCRSPASLLISRRVHNSLSVARRVVDYGGRPRGRSPSPAGKTRVCRHYYPITAAAGRLDAMNIDEALRTLLDSPS
ncbi:hypothetical protein EVAR_11652_1 [Eumeta japonica]|uniref:Uncharacterized protein n=1 Tax=Eumeta variegata TaxID=151549 RepID=A0A4C1WU00_EUMVA|nr:hypothetical protein EVAR_11652_1 [Eumeta japonica]